MECRCCVVDCDGVALRCCCCCLLLMVVPAKRQEKRMGGVPCSKQTIQDMIDWDGVALLIKKQSDFKNKIFWIKSGGSKNSAHRQKKKGRRKTQKPVLSIDISSYGNQGIKPQPHFEFRISFFRRNQKTRKLVTSGAMRSIIIVMVVIMTVNSLANTGEDDEVAQLGGVDEQLDGLDDENTDLKQLEDMFANGGYRQILMEGKALKMIGSDKSRNNNDYRRRLLMILANAYRLSEDFKEAARWYSELIRATTDQKSRDFAAVLYGLADIHVGAKQYGKAGDVVMQALSLLEELKHPDPVLEAQLQTTLGDLERMQERPTESLKFYQDALALLGPKDTSEARSTVLQSMAWAFFQTQRYAEAKHAFEDALAICRLLNGLSHPSCAHVVVHLADLHYKQGNLKETIEHLEEALHMREKSLGPAHWDTTSTKAAIEKVWRQLEKADL